MGDCFVRHVDHLQLWPSLEFALPRVCRDPRPTERYFSLTPKVILLLERTAFARPMHYQEFWQPSRLSWPKRARARRLTPNHFLILNAEITTDT